MEICFYRRHDPRPRIPVDVLPRGCERWSAPVWPRRAGVGYGLMYTHGVYGPWCHAVSAEKRMALEIQI